jgi:hypothetical protein
MRVLVGCLLLAFVVFSSDVRAEAYTCPRVIARANGRHDIAGDSHATLAFVGGREARIKIYLPGTKPDKPLTFRVCERTNDGRSFARWFDLECLSLQNVDGTLVDSSLRLDGVYGGVSPVVTSAYDGWEDLVAASREVGRAAPKRTLVLFSPRGEPLYRYFCWR